MIRPLTIYRNALSSPASALSLSIIFFAISFDFSSAALYSFKYLLSDLTPILQPSVIRSAMTESDSLTLNITLVLSQLIPLAIGFGSLPLSE